MGVSIAVSLDYDIKITTIYNPQCLRARHRHIEKYWYNSLSVNELVTNT